MIIKTRTKVLIARIISRVVQSLRLNKNPTTVVTRKNICYRLDLNEGIDLAIYLGVYENSTVKAYRRLIKNGDYVIDIGANIGAHTLQFADLVGDSGRVIAFEPTDYAFSKLQTNIGLNPRLSARIIANQIMLAENESESKDSLPELYSSWPLIPGGVVHPDHWGKKMTTLTAKLTTLDSYIHDHDIHKVDVVKMDVDGYEYSVLKGSISMIRKFCPVFVMELCPYLLEEAGHDIGEILAIFESVNYQMRDIVSGRLLPSNRERLCSLISKGASVNIIVSKR